MAIRKIVINVPRVKEKLLIGILNEIPLICNTFSIIRKKTLEKVAPDIIPVNREAVPISPFSRTIIFTICLLDIPKDRKRPNSYCLDFIKEEWA